LASMTKSLTIFTKKYPYLFKVWGWSRKPLWSYSLSASHNFKSQLYTTVSLFLKTVSPAYDFWRLTWRIWLHYDRLYPFKSNPKSYRWKERSGSKLSLNGRTRKIYPHLIHWVRHNQRSSQDQRSFTPSAPAPSINFRLRQEKLQHDYQTARQRKRQIIKLLDKESAKFVKRCSFVPW
jgi:hypothetical protein